MIKSIDNFKKRLVGHRSKPKRVTESTHLCAKCRYEFATCSATDIVFSDKEDADNVVCCDGYEGR